jgi:small redox-active disulfide protein 2
MEIRILGTGCAKCHKLEAETRQVATDMQLDCTIEKVTELKDIMSYGVMLTPALVVDGTVKVVGKVPSRDELKELLS